ncbi:hypothetical protein I315_05469 [Cryptococcus gattii Ru294]|nr:hypothetical protein I315_05469 [Cryptococcus gattii Ru294]
MLTKNNRYLLRAAERELRDLELLPNPSADDMITHESVFNKLWTRAVDLSTKLDEFDRIDLFLDTLPEDPEFILQFATFRQLEGDKADKNAQTWVGALQIYHKMIAEKDARNNDSKKEMIIASVRKDQEVVPVGNGQGPKRSWIDKKTCFQCSKKGHLGRKCPSRTEEKTSKPPTKELWAAKIEPNVEAGDEPSLFPFTTRASPSTNITTSFLVDSGADQHCTSDMRFLSHYVRQPNLGNVKVPGGHRMSIEKV